MCRHVWALSRVMFVTGMLLALPVAATEEPPAPAPQPALDEESGERSIVPPQIILNTQKAPQYPPAALAGRFSGTVKVQATILPDGRVGAVKAIECDHPNLGFEQASVDAVKKWRFEPAMEDGQPIEYVTSFRLNFRSTGSGTNSKVYVSAGAASSSDAGEQDRAVRRETTASTGRASTGTPQKR